MGKAGYGGDANNLPKGLAVDRSGDATITGQTSGTTDLGGGPIGNGGIFVAESPPARMAVTGGQRSWVAAPVMGSLPILGPGNIFADLVQPQAPPDFGGGPG